MKRKFLGLGIEVFKGSKLGFAIAGAALTGVSVLSSIVVENFDTLTSGKGNKSTKKGGQVE